MHACNNILTLFNLQENLIELNEGDTIATKVNKYPDWPQVAEVLSVKKKTCLVQWLIEEEDGHFITWLSKENGTKVTEEIKKKDILFTIALTDGFLSESDRVKINSFK